MRSVTYAYLGHEDGAGGLAKKGTETDVVLYNGKQDDAHLNLAAPARYPERLQGLLACLDMADRVVLHPKAMDRTLGELVVGCELFGKDQGYARPSDHVTTEELESLLSKTGLSSLSVTDEPDATLRDRLYEHATASSYGALVLALDHAFPVKGVGTVALGLVRSGQVARHDQLRAYPTDREVSVRSIQVHDVDHDQVPARSRVGLAVKGAEADQLPRGTVLAPEGSLEVWQRDEPRTLTIQATPFMKWRPRADTTLHAYHCLQDTVFRITEATPAADGAWDLTGSFERDMARVPGQPMVFVDLDNETQRFVGRLG